MKKSVVELVVQWVLVRRFKWFGNVCFVRWSNKDCKSGWYFGTEDEALAGPFGSKKRAMAELKEYCRKLG